MPLRMPAELIGLAPDQIDHRVAIAVPALGQDQQRRPNDLLPVCLATTIGNPSHQHHLGLRALLDPRLGTQLGEVPVDDLLLQALGQLRLDFGERRNFQFPHVIELNDMPAELALHRLD
jgi:hypothetical protein